VPGVAVKFTNQNILYSDHNSTFVTDERLAKGYEFLNKDELQNVIQEYATKYLESFIIMGNRWFFITSIETYYYNHLEYDDCAQN
jgi:hypothetical protein